MYLRLCMEFSSVILLYHIGNIFPFFLEGKMGNRGSCYELVFTGW